MAACFPPLSSLALISATPNTRKVVWLRESTPMPLATVLKGENARSAGARAPPRAESDSPPIGPDRRASQAPLRRSSMRPGWPLPRLSRGSAAGPMRPIRLSDAASSAKGSVATASARLSPPTRPLWVPPQLGRQRSVTARGRVRPSRLVAASCAWQRESQRGWPSWASLGRAAGDRSATSPAVEGARRPHGVDPPLVAWSCGCTPSSRGGCCPPSDPGRSSRSRGGVLTSRRWPSVLSSPPRRTRPRAVALPGRGSRLAGLVAVF